MRRWCTQAPPARSSKKISDASITALARALPGLSALQELDLKFATPPLIPWVAVGEAGMGGMGKGGGARAWQGAQSLGRGRECRRGGGVGHGGGVLALCKCAHAGRVGRAGRVTRPRMGRGA